MYSIDIIKASINLYYKLEQQSIIGIKRNNIITNVFNIHINTLYNWINKYYNKNTNSYSFTNYNTNFKYNNSKATIKLRFISLTISSLHSQ